MRWVSVGTNEFAFLSVNGTAQGVIAIGGVAHGVIAIGGVASAGVISIGMNAAGSVLAIGMNAVAPISLSLINGLGIWVLAGVNGWGTWAQAGTNASGLVSRGGVNSGQSVFPTALMIAFLIVISSLVRGRRTPRAKSDALTLRAFVARGGRGAERVRARLVALADDAVELAAGDRRLVLVPRDPALVESARALVGAEVIAAIEPEEHWVADPAERGYRERPPGETETRLTCQALQAAPEPETWLPRDAAETQWVIAWTARVAAAGAIASIALFGG
jgi:hypothetical protein